MSKISHFLNKEAVRFTNYLQDGKKHRSKLVAGLFALMVCLVPMSAMAADPAASNFGNAAKAQIELITPQVTTVGLAIITVIGVIVAVYIVMRMLKKV